MLPLISSADAVLAAGALGGPAFIAVGLYLLARRQRPAMVLRRRIAAAPDPTAMPVESRQPTPA